MPDEIADYNTAQAANNQFDEVVEQVATTNQVKDPDLVVGLCSDCQSTQPDQAMIRSIFAQQGLAPVCRYCGGPVVITYYELVEQTREQIRRARGLA